VIALHDGEGKGSGRSIKGFHLFDAVSAAAEHLKEFGGHEQAVGLNVSKKNIAAFRQAINDYALTVLTPDKLIRTVKSELDIGFSELTASFLRELALLEPYGIGNPKPLFKTDDLKVKNKPRKIYGESYEILLTDGTNHYAAALAEKDLYLCSSAGTETSFEVIYTVKIRSWNGMETISLDIKSIRQT